jgi:hypothetical protein
MRVLGKGKQKQELLVKSISWTMSAGLKSAERDQIFNELGVDETPGEGHRKAIN